MQKLTTGCFHTFPTGRHVRGNRGNIDAQAAAQPPLDNAQSEFCRVWPDAAENSNARKARKSQVGFSLPRYRKKQAGRYPPNLGLYAFTAQQECFTNVSASLK